MEHMTAGRIAEVCGGTLLLGNPQTAVEHISLDSRKMKGNDLFVPLSGEHVDSHHFISQAMENGAVATFTSRHDRVPSDASGVWIRVKDTKKALQTLGSFCRSLLHIPVIGVTGSVGKTTTREMIAAALSAKYQVFKTPDNYNSQVGVPVTLSEIKETDEIAVIELGMSEPGEMTVIAQIAQTDIAVITNIGVTHIGQLGSQENIFREKMSIQDGLKPGGTLILNGDDAWLVGSQAKEGCHTVYYGTSQSCDYRAEDIILKEGYPSFTAVFRDNKIPVHLNVMGIHQVGNALAALAVADLNGVPLEAAAETLAHFDGYKGRQRVYHLCGITIIDDTYNASPASMKAAIDILASQKKARRRIAVLADMKELGAEEIQFHREVGSYLASSPVDVLLTCGELAKEIEIGARQNCPDIFALHFQETKELEQYLLKHLEEGDAVLMKGSNSMKLGEVAQHVICQHHH